MAARTRNRVCSRTLGWSLSTRETVWWDTPASRATSVIAGLRAAFGSIAAPSSPLRARIDDRRELPEDEINPHRTRPGDDTPGGIVSDNKNDVNLLFTFGP